MKKVKEFWNDVGVVKSFHHEIRRLKILKSKSITGKDVNRIDKNNRILRNGG